MRTDKQVYLIFRAGPELAFELAALPSPGPCRMESTTFKEIERTTDGLIVPEDADQPLSLLEVQFYEDAAIYNRTATMMALAQQPHLPRPVQGMIFFATRALDPQTAPWNGIIRPVYLDEALSALKQSDPLHPLVAVFAPVFIEASNELEGSAKHYYHALENASVAPDLRHTLLRVFCDWLFERLKHKTRKEITMILDLPDVRDTVVGRELLEEGIEEGRGEGILSSLTLVGMARFGPCDEKTRGRISRLPESEMQKLLVAMLELDSWRAVSAWLDARER